MGKTKRITFRIDDLKDELEAACKFVGIDEPTILRACAKAFVDEVKRTGEIRLPLAIVSKKDLVNSDPPTSHTPPQPVRPTRTDDPGHIKAPAPIQTPQGAIYPNEETPDPKHPHSDAATEKPFPSKARAALQAMVKKEKGKKN